MSSWLERFGLAFVALEFRERSQPQIPSTPTDLIDNRPDSILFSPLRLLVHHCRVLGYIPFVFYNLFRRPKRTAQAIASYYALRQSALWRRLVRGFLTLGSSRQPKMVRAQTKPYDANKQYLLCAHPHGILNGSWWNLICRFGLKIVDNLELIMCVAPAVQWYPLYGELFGDRVTDASRQTIERILRKTNLTPCLIPGGFSEATFTNAHPDVEYAYIADRYGFIKLAIEAKVDIIVAYSFGLNDMYKTLEWQRHWRAVQAQALGLPTVLWAGPFLLGNVPYTEKITVVTFDPFPTSQYTVDQLEQAHADYCDYLKRCFDEHKASCGAGHKRLEFIGKSVPPQLVAKL